MVCWICTCAILYNLLLEDGYIYENFEHDSDMFTNPNEDDPETPVPNDPHDRANRKVLQFHGDINT